MHPVGRRVSVQWPTRRPGTSVNDPRAAGEVDDCLEEMIARQTVPDPRTFETEYYNAIEAVLGEGQLALPPDQRPILGGRRGHHSEHLGHLLAVMQFLPRTYPDAVW